MAGAACAGEPAHAVPPGGTRCHPANQHRHDRRTRGERLADRVIRVFGSWRFIVVQTVAVAAWVAVNLLVLTRHWDPYPFILLNLLFSTQAAYAAPLILLSQNRQADSDRIKAEHDYGVNRLALTYLIAWHRDAHGADCRCVEQTAPDAEATLSNLEHDPAAQPEPETAASGSPPMRTA